MSSPLLIMGNAIMDEAIPSGQRSEPGSVNIPRAVLPRTAKDLQVDAAAVATKIIDSLDHSLQGEDYDAIAGLFLADCYWRDHLALSWNLRTVKGRDNITAYLKSGCSLTKVELDTTSAWRSPQVVPFDGKGEVKGIQFYTKIVTKFGTGRGFGRLAQTDDGWKIWTFFTALREIDGHEESIGRNRPRGVEHGSDPDRKNWADRREDDREFRNQDPDVLIIGEPIPTRV
jgi:hypothetical protein